MAVETCPGCGGATTVDDKICTSCMGTGGTGLAGVPRFLKEHVVDILTKSNDTLTKCNDALSKLVLLQTDVDIVEATTGGSSTDIAGIEEKVTDILNGQHLPSVVFPWFYDSITAGTFTHSQDANYYHNANFHNDSPWADGNQVDYKVFLSEGTYSFKFTHVKGDVFGIFKLLLDDSEKGSVDCYAATKTYNNISNIDDVVVTLAGVKTMSIKVDGKNASATSYKLNLSAIHITKTA